MKPSITLEQVKQAIETLEKAGTKVTCKAIRQHCGGGSYSTICKHLHALGRSNTQARTKSFDLIGYISEQVYGVLSSRFCTKDEFEKLRREMESIESKESSPSAPQESPTTQTATEVTPLTQIQSINAANETESSASFATESEL